MSEISQREVEHVAKLAQLELSDPEKDLFAEQLSQILTYVEQLQEVETAGIPPTASVAQPDAILREDIPRESLANEQALANAPHAEEGFFVVPKIISK